MSISRGVTPTFTFNLPESVDLTEAKNVYVTFKQNRTSLTKTDLEVSAHTVEVYLSQAETRMFDEGTVAVQLNWTYADGQRAATVIKKVYWTQNLLDKVVE